MALEWCNLEKIEVEAGGGVTASVAVPVDSPWFSGHFPGDPVLPAIAQLAIVFGLARKAFGRKLIPRALARTKFRRIIRPGETVDIVLSPVSGSETRYSFQLTVSGEIACKGAIQMEPAK